MALRRLPADGLYHRSGERLIAISGEAKPYAPLITKASIPFCPTDAVPEHILHAPLSHLSNVAGREVAASHPLHVLVKRSEGRLRAAPIDTKPSHDAFAS